MSELDPPFSMSDVDIEEDRLVFNGFFKMHDLRLRHRRFDGGWSDVMSRELFHRGEACAAVLYDPVLDCVGLVDQFRVGALASDHGPWCLEVVAGMVEQGESPEEVIRRELVEEAGIKEAELIPITRYYSSPGGCSEQIHLFCALCDLSGGGGLFGVDHENEDIRFTVQPASTIFAQMFSSRMNNAATLLGLQWLQINRKSLRERR